MFDLLNQKIKSRFFIGTSLYSNLQEMSDCIDASGSDVLTVSLRRNLGKDQNQNQNEFWNILKNKNLKILPNTAGCYSVNEAVQTAFMAREVFNTNWIKLEVIGDDYTLQPDPIGLLEATKELVKNDFQVFPYTTDDIVIAKKLVDHGCEILMPWASPIGSGLGISRPHDLKRFRKTFENQFLVVDAGLGKPSDATIAMEMGFDAVLLNTAIARSQNPVKMATAFQFAIQSGRLSYEAGRMPKREFATPSTPEIGKPFWRS